MGGSKINFRLEQTYNDVVLRLARGGDETTVVTIDGKRTYIVTNTMLGSGEGYRVGIQSEARCTQEGQAQY